MRFYRMTAALGAGLWMMLGGAAMAADDLSSLSDEFNDEKTLGTWRRVYQDEQWPANQLERFDINKAVQGCLLMMPYTSTWYRDYRGELTYKPVEGDFVVTTRLRVTGRDGQSAPRRQFSLGGIMIRAPRNITPQTWRPGGENYIFLSLGAADPPGRYQWETKTTVNSDSQLRLADANTSEGIIQAARIGPHFILLRQAPNEPWTVHQRYYRPDLPDRLQ
ncbi:MAG: hypothetical protein M3347_02685, partial [Armatimonadota bacterium]|nr:hypothetical protein [Armatimonadota bacterium]